MATPTPTPATPKPPTPAAATASHPSKNLTLEAIEQKITGIETAINANTAAINSLLTGILIPLSTPVKEVSLPARGLAQTATVAVAVPEGLRTTMTKDQHILHVVAGTLQVVFLLASLALYFVPTLGTSSIVGGVTIAALISGIKNLVNPFLTSYGDTNIPVEIAPRVLPVAPVV